MVARSSLLRRPTPGARPARRTSSVVAALAALAPRLVRLARHRYPDGLLVSRRAGTAGPPRPRLEPRAVDRDGDRAAAVGAQHARAACAVARLHLRGRE